MSRPRIPVGSIAGSLSFSTYESYETTLRRLVVPQCGEITLGALTVGRCDRVSDYERLLGHANEQITRASYIDSADEVDVTTAEILDELPGS